MDIFIVVVLCFVGILLVLLEIFLIPGVTFALIAGLLFGAGGVFYAYSKLGMTGGTITLVSMLVLFGATFIWLIKSKALDKTIALNTHINSTVATNDSLNVKEGDEGVCLSRLNPIGKVKVNGVTMEAKSFGEFIDEGTPVVILKVNSMQLIVRSIN